MISQTKLLIFSSTLLALTFAHPGQHHLQRRMIENIVPFDDSMVIEDYNNLEDDFKRSFFLPERGLELDPTSTTSKPTEPTTNSSEIGVSVVPTDDGGIQRPVFLDPCKNVFCQSGRVCRSTVDGKGECVCANASHCHHQHARKKICGSDGHFYNSHCELHRTACLKNVRISFDRSGVRCRDSTTRVGLSSPSLTTVKQKSLDVNRTKPKARYNSSSVSLNNQTKIFTTSVTSGSSVELKCDIDELIQALWKRNGHSLDSTTDVRIKIFQDGSLYIGDLGLEHMANYTCLDKFDENKTQTHVLLVLLPPVINILAPSQAMRLPGSAVTMKCRAEGVPVPEINWEKNDWSLDLKSESSEDSRYLLLYKDSVLEIKSLDYKHDTGTFKCSAKNIARTSERLAATFMENSTGAVSVNEGDSAEMRGNELFLVFHNHGYTIFEVNQCHMEHHVTGDYNFPTADGSLAALTLCRSNDSCSWGDAVIVGNKFVYISQQSNKRIVVLEITDRSNPVEIITLDHEPGDLHYVEQLDQVWVTCVTDPQVGKDSVKVIGIISQASENTKHELIIIQPAKQGANSYQIENIFLAPSNDLKHKFDFGYVAMRYQTSLHKLDLISFKYVREIDLSQHDCLPKQVVFLPLGGKIVVSCESVDDDQKSSVIILDYITDGVLDQLIGGGRMFVSPDVRHLVIIKDEGNTISVYKITDEGNFDHVFDEYTQMHISDIAFFPSETGSGYNLFASAPESVLFMELNTGRLAIVEGLGEEGDALDWSSNNHGRNLVSGGMFSEFLMTPSERFIFVIDGRRRHVQCKWNNVMKANIIIPLNNYNSNAV